MGQRALLSLTGLLFGVVLVWFLQQRMEKLLQNHPEILQKTMVAHCRHQAGLALLPAAARPLPPAEVESLRAQCDEIRLERIEIGGGMLHPLMVRLSLDRNGHLPEGKSVFVFKSLSTAPPLLDSLSSLVTRHWAFNHFVSYSDESFRHRF
ncbi:MAG: hypothetical protein RIR00_789 [Pseudomonadota bacterium]|jgi:hypothetical protein